MTQPQSAIVPLGPAGLTLSRTIPGLMRLFDWKLDAPALNHWIHACLEMGCTTFDHADIYGGYAIEAAFGKALALTPGLRDKIQLVTKCGIGLVTPNRPDTRVHHYDTSRAHILASAERSLENLRTDRIDLLLVHRPDPLMDADEVATALSELRRSGKVLHCGVSNFLPFQLELLQSRLDFPMLTNQIEFSVTHMQPIYDGTLDQAQRLRMPPMIWGPLGGGRIFTSTDERGTRLLQILEKIGGQIGATPDQVALAWILMHPARPLPVLGTGRLERISAAVAAEAIQLDRQSWFEIWEASVGHEVP